MKTKLWSIPGLFWAVFVIIRLKVLEFGFLPLSCFFVAGIMRKKQSECKLKKVIWNSKWWQLKYVLCSLRNMGKVNPFWGSYSYFSDGWGENHQLEYVQSMSKNAVRMCLIIAFIMAWMFCSLSSDFFKSLTQATWNTAACKVEGCWCSREKVVKPLFLFKWAMVNIDGDCWFKMFAWLMVINDGKYQWWFFGVWICLEAFSRRLHKVNYPPVN